MSVEYTVKTPVRVAFLQVIEPRLNTMNGKEEYSVTLMIPKSDTKLVAEIKAAIQEALVEFTPKFKNGTVPNRWKNPLRDADDPNDRDDMAMGEKYAEFAGHYYLRAKKDALRGAPGVFDTGNQRVTGPGQVKSGDWMFAVISLYGFNQSGNQGIAAGLNGLKLARSGEAFAMTDNDGGAIMADLSDPSVTSDGVESIL